MVQSNFDSKYYNRDKYIDGWRCFQSITTHFLLSIFLVSIHEFLGLFLSFQGLAHKVTDKCGDVCACILQKKEVGECCLWRCQVKVLEITGYGGSSKELKQMGHFLEKLKRLEIVKVGVQQENNNHGEYLRVTNGLMKLPRI